MMDQWESQIVQHDHRSSIDRTKIEEGQIARIGQETVKTMTTQTMVRWLKGSHAELESRMARGPIGTMQTRDISSKDKAKGSTTIGISLLTHFPMLVGEITEIEQGKETEMGSSEISISKVL